MATRQAPDTDGSTAPPTRALTKTAMREPVPCGALSQAWPLARLTPATAYAYLRRSRRVRQASPSASRHPGWHQYRDAGRPESPQKDSTRPPPDASPKDLVRRRLFPSYHWRRRARFFPDRGNLARRARFQSQARHAVQPCPSDMQRPLSPLALGLLAPPHEARQGLPFSHAPVTLGVESRPGDDQ